MSRLLMILIFLVSSLAMAQGALADETQGWAVDRSEDGFSLFLYFSDVGNPEDLVATITCAHGEGDAFVGSSVQIIADDATPDAARFLVDQPPNPNVAIFRLATVEVTGSVAAFEMQSNELIGGWDLTLRLNDYGIMFPMIAEASLSGPVVLDIGGTAFDLTPRAEDRKVWLDFARGCAA